MQEYVEEKHGISVSRYIISRALKRVEHTHKKLKYRAAQRNQLLRESWKAKIATFKASQLVFLDESGANPRTGNRRYGWSPKGRECITDQELKRTANWSLLPAYSLDGYIGAHIYQGSFNADRFEDFIIDVVLPQCQAFPNDRSVIILDNASIHNTDGINRACLRAGVILLFLPPYSPDFNPIELSFHDLKVWIRRNNKEIDQYITFGDFLLYAIKANGSGGNAKGHFQHCYITVE
jgi:hypothetical protein